MSQQLLSKMERRDHYCIDDVKKAEPYIQRGGYSFFQKEKIYAIHTHLSKNYMHQNAHWVQG